MGAPASEIKRENVKEFFAWAFLGKAHFDAADEDELEDYVERMESLLGRKMNAGKGRAMCLRLTIDKIDMLHRSLVWYFCVFFVDTLTSLRMLNNSFHFHRTSFSRLFTLFPPRPFHSLSRHHSPAKHLTYWHRPHTSNTKLPILFIHGIGIGLYPYVNFLIELNQGVDIDEKDADVGIIAIEIMPVSFRITHGALEKDKMCEEIQQILQKHGWGRFVLVSHSYGSVISTHLLQTPKIANNVGPVLLIDPVAFLLHLPDVAFNFTCRKPQRANEYQLWYFASKDMGVAHTLSRHFFWSENILWRHDLEGRRVTVSLAGRDLIVNTDAVGRYLTGNDVGVQIKDGAGGDDTWKDRQWKGTGLDVLWFSKLDHAQIFDSKLDRGRMISVLAEYCKME
ncbi:MAG: hypothetical protein M1827_003915 [Pycnora praestabilis]|nr:MAG: hypothetical protein M1827_003915 [Pycnora praestabilis]